jgi:hypothetical protein
MQGLKSQLARNFSVQINGCGSVPFGELGKRASSVVPCRLPCDCDDAHCLVIVFWRRCVRLARTGPIELFPRLLLLCALAGRVSKRWVCGHLLGCRSQARQKWLDRILSELHTGKEPETAGAKTRAGKSLTSAVPTVSNLKGSIMIVPVSLVFKVGHVWGFQNRGMREPNRYVTTCTLCSRRKVQITDNSIAHMTKNRALKSISIM